MTPPVPPEPDPPEPGPDPPEPEPTPDFYLYDENSLTKIENSSGTQIASLRCYGYVKVGDSYYYPKISYEQFDGDDWSSASATGCVFVSDGTTSGLIAWGNYLGSSGNRYSNINKYNGTLNIGGGFRNASVSWCERYSHEPAADQTVFSKIGSSTSCTYEVDT